MSLNRPCPVCAASAARPIWHESGYRYVLCARCTAVFSDISEDAYVRLRHNVWDEEQPSGHATWFYRDMRAAVHEDFLAYLDAHRPPGRLFDVGCGLGVFMQRARDHGWEVNGCDTSASWVAQARDLLGAPETVVHADVLELGAPAGGYDLITLWDVIEHIYRPLDVLAHLRTLLAPRGQVFIRTPNIVYVWPVYGLRRLLLGHTVELGPLNHVVYFQRATMGRALACAGLAPRVWRVFRPPQVPLGNSTASVRLKNAYARIARASADVSGGRVVVASDLDVFAEAAR
jgi:2-polyprenyl-3-methyl-5-hydroxy-6-metoxy-1,4-benzoquinol methylase